MSPARNKRTKQEVWGLAEDLDTIVKKETIEPSDIKLETEEDPLSLPEESYQGKLTNNVLLLKLSHDFPRPQEWRAWIHIRPIHVWGDQAGPKSDKHPEQQQG